MKRSTAQPFDLERELALAVASGDPAALLDQALVLTRKARQKSTLAPPLAGLRLQLVGYLRHECKILPCQIARHLGITQARVGQMLVKHRERYGAVES